MTALLTACHPESVSSLWERKCKKQERGKNRSNVTGEKMEKNTKEQLEEEEDSKRADGEKEDA